MHDSAIDMLQLAIITAIESGNWDLYSDDKELALAQRKDFADYVVAQLTMMHPTQLSLVLLQVAAARSARYLSPHPSFYTAIIACMENDAGPSSDMNEAKQNMYVKAWNGIFRQQLKRLIQLRRTFNPKRIG